MPQDNSPLFSQGLSHSEHRADVKLDHVGRFRGRKLFLENAIIAACSEMDPFEDWKIHQDFMKVAIEEAKLGMREGGIPIGSLLVRDGKIIGHGHNKRVQERDPTSHAEIDCLRKTGRIGSYSGTTLYSTLMPCYLCAGAVVQFGIKKVVVGESTTFPGAEELMVSRGVQVINLNLDECKEIMKQFIKKNPKLWNEDIGKL